MTIGDDPMTTMGISSNVAGMSRRRRLPAIRLPEVATIAILISLYSSLVYFLFGLGFSLLQPNYIYGLVYLVGAFTYVTSAAARRAIVGHTTIIIIWVALIFIMVLQFFIFPIGHEGVGLLVGRIHFFLTMTSMLLLLSACGRFGFVVAALGWVIVASCAVNLVEFFFGGSAFEWMSNVPGRAAGLFENSNDSAMFICMGIPIVAIGLTARTRGLFYAATILGVYVTFSRGGLVTWAVFVAATELMLSYGYGKRGWGTRAFVGAVVILGAVSAVSYFSTDLTKLLTEALWPYLDANTSARIEFLSQDSTDARMSVATRGLEAFSSAPIFGQGIGYTHSWDVGYSVHNMIVLMLAELGLIGGLWIGVFLLSLWRYGRPYGALIFLIVLVTGLFSHNHFERPAVAIAVALYLVAAQKLSSGRRTSLVGQLRNGMQ